MGYNFAGAGEGDQLLLMPPDPREWLPPGHLAWELRELVAGLDLAPFMAWYRADGQGRPAYHPQLMVTLICYCYCKGVRSSRAIEMATWDDVGARVICGGLHPDHSTVARFMTRHEQAVKGLLVASLVACARQGLVSVDVVAGDGTVVKANASMAANATAAQLEADIAGLEQLIEAEVAAWMARAREEDAAEDTLFGGGGGGGGSSALARLTGRLVRRQKAKARLEAAEAASQDAAGATRAETIGRLQEQIARNQQWAAREAAACQARVDDYAARAEAKAAAGSRKRPDGRAPVAPGDSKVVRRARKAAEDARQKLAAVLAAAAGSPAAAGRPARANTTDPASRVIPAKHGGYVQGYNVQALAGRHQVILGIGVHDNPADTRALHPLLAAARANLDAAGITSPIGKALFDAGYASDANFTTPCEPELYVSVRAEARQAGRLRDDGGKPLPSLPSWQAMATRLGTPEGKELYKQRSAMIEPVFAQLFSPHGRDLHYRDTRVDLELHLRGASHNFLKAIRKIRRQAARPSLAPAT
jgi:transposase